MSARLTIFAQQARAEAREVSHERRSEIAREVAGQARGAAPVLTGAYRSGIGVAVSGKSVSVIDTDPDAIHKEYGVKHRPAHGVLTAAAQRAGKYRGMRPRGMR